MKAYILIYGNKLGSFDEVKDWLDQCDLVKWWRTEMPNTIFLISEASAAELTADIDRELWTSGSYLILEASENRAGKLAKESWYLLRHKRHKPRDPA